MSKLTVAICTHDRSGLLAQALQSLVAAASSGAADYEVLVVLNNCSDDSEGTALGFADQLPLRVVNEPQPGLSFARNCAVKHAAGDMTAWIDDDVRVHAGWLKAYAEAMERWPNVAFFGGPIRPLFEAPSPPWLGEALPAFGSVFGECTPKAADECLITADGPKPFGANYAVRTAIQRRYLYDPSLGRAPDTWLRHGEETAVIDGMLADGCEGRWVNEAAVDHMIAPERQTLRYIRAYYAGHGRLRALHKCKRRLRPFAFLWDTVRLADLELRYLAARLLSPPERWAAALRRAARARGRWLGRYIGT